MAKLDEITTFNLDGNTYAVSTLNQDMRELLTVYLETEDTIRGHKKALLVSQHALASMGNMFRDLIKDLPALSPEEVDRLAAAAAVASGTVPQPPQPANDPAIPGPAVKRPSINRKRGT
jgi:hypothetical protein